MFIKDIIKRSWIFKFYRLFTAFFLYYFMNRIISFFPCWFLRKSYMKILGIKIGKYSRIDMGIYIKGTRKLKIGNYVHINQNSILMCDDSIEIGNYVSISHRVGLFTGSHDIQSKDFANVCSKIKIDDYVWVGANAMILSGKREVTIGKGAVVCAGAVVTKDVEPFNVVAGVPAKVIGKRNENLNYFPLKDVFWGFQ